MGSSQGKAAKQGNVPPGAAVIPNAKILQQDPAMVYHQPANVKAAAVVHTHDAAYQLDIADGILDGKYYGAEIRVVPPGVYPAVGPAVPTYQLVTAPSVGPNPYSRPLSGPPSVHRGYPGAMAQPAPAYGRSSCGGDLPVPGTVLGMEYRQVAGFGASHCTTYCDGAPPPVMGAHGPPPIMGPRGSIADFPASVVRGQYGEQFPGKMYEYDSGSYTRGPRPEGDYADPHFQEVPPPKPPTMIDNYSPGATVEFFTKPKSPYAHLLANQARNVGHTQLVAPSPPQYVEVQRPGQQSLSPLPRATSLPHSVQRSTPGSSGRGTVLGSQAHAQPHSQPHGQAPAADHPYAPAQQSRFEGSSKPFGAVPTYEAEPSYSFDGQAPEGHVRDTYEEAPEMPTWEENDPDKLGGIDADTSARMAFRRYDTDGNGFLDIYEFMAAMKVLGSGTSFAEAKEVFAMIDTDGGGSIEEDEFVRWYIRNFDQIRESNDPKMLAQSIFRKYDKDGNGTLDVEEFVGAMRELGLGYTMEDAQYVFDTFDNDAGGTIDEAEFIEQYYQQWLQMQ